MKSSIRMKFFFNFFIILLIAEISLILLSKFLLDDLIVSANKILIQQVYNEYKPYFALQDVDQDKINEISSTNDLGIIIYNNGTVTACDSGLNCSESPALPDYLSKYLPLVPVNGSWSHKIDLSLIQVNQLVYFYNLGNGQYVIFDKTLTAINEINEILQPFIIGFGILIFIIGSIVIFMTSRKITKPIIDISRYASDIANLQFGGKIEVKGKNELSLLANNMNLINEKLDEALTLLGNKNKLLEEDLDKERELDRKRVKFFSTVSHEFKTPLTIIQGYAEGLKHHIANTNETKEEYYDIIIEETKKMYNFVNDLLNLSMYESDNFTLAKSNFNIVELIYKTVDKFGEALRQKKAELFIEGSRKCMVNADKYRLEQVITNILSNAIKYISDKGYIKIDVKDKENTVLVTFFNNGEKIPEAEIDHIWSLFYKLENNKNHMGTGIGLAIVKSIVELHNGKCGAQNLPDGVRFYIEIPK